MFLRRIIASVLLLAMTLVMAGAVVHAHEHVEVPMRETVMPAGEHEDGAVECALCKVTKERVTMADASVAFVVGYSVVPMSPLVRNLISDRCPQKRTGRAPPRG